MTIDIEYLVAQGCVGAGVIASLAWTAYLLTLAWEIAKVLR